MSSYANHPHEQAQSMIAALLNSKWFAASGFAAATTTLTADKIATAAPSLPVAINYIGTHGPAEWFSWADLMAAGSGLLILLNLLVFAVKGWNWVKPKITKRRRARK